MIIYFISLCVVANARKHKVIFYIKSMKKVSKNNQCITSQPICWQTTYFKNNICVIIIRSAHTVCGHEALQLAKCLTEELANQATQASGRSLGNRVDSPELEPRARSYDQKSPQKNKGSFYAYVLAAIWHEEGIYHCLGWSLVEFS